MNFLKNVSLVLFGISVALFALLVYTGEELLAATGLIVLLLGWTTAGVHSALLEVLKEIKQNK